MVLSVIEFLNGGFLLLNVFSKNGNINNLHFNMRSIVDLFHIRVLLYQKWSIMKARSADKPTVYMYVAEFVSCTMTKIKYISKVQKNILPANCRWRQPAWMVTEVHLCTCKVLPTRTYPLLLYCLCLNSASLAWNATITFSSLETKDKWWSPLHTVILALTLKTVQADFQFIKLCQPRIQTQSVVGHFCKEIFHKKDICNIIGLSILN